MAAELPDRQKPLVGHAIDEESASNTANVLGAFQSSAARGNEVGEPSGGETGTNVLSRN